MSDRPSRELDELFQKGSELYDFEYNPEAWKDMEERLDKDRRRRFIWWFFGLGGICILILLTYTLNYDKEKNVILSSTNINKVEDKNKSEKQTSQIDTSLQENLNNTEDINLKEKQEEIISPKSKINAIEYQQPKYDNKEQENPSLTENDELNTSDSNVDQMIALPAFIDNDDNKEQENNSIEEDQKQVEPVVDDTSVSLRISKIVETIPTLPFVELTTSEQVDNESKLLEDLFEEKSDDLIKQKQDNSFLIGLLFAAESSSAGIDDFSKFNGKYGALVEYRFRQKLGISVGVNLINKKYAAGQGDYTPEKGFWVRTIAPQSTTADCKILEIPLVASYYSKGYKKNGFYTSIGLVSYFMLAEQYNYFYDLPDPDLKRNWGTENTNKHWLGVGQLSFGYQYFVTPSTPIQFAPYLQIPIAGVGHGNVKLWSAGLMLKMNLKVK